jgi:arylsulfatase
VGSLCQRQAHNYYPTHLWSDDERVDLAGNDFFKSHQKLSAPLENEDLYYERFARRSYATDHFIEGALEFLRAQRDEAFFLYYSSPIPHAALQVPRREVEAYRDAFPETPYLGNKGYLPHPTPRAAYAAMVSRLDREVGRILDELDALGLAKNTVVLFTSDNGPTFNGGSDSKFFDSAPGMRGLKCSVYEGGLRIPLVVRWPGKVAAGTWTEHLSGFQDMLPTLAEIAGIDLDGVALQLDGLSFVPTLGGAEEVAEHECLYWEYAGQQALRAGNWKGVRKRLRKGDLSLELYNLADDPGEQNDVAGEHPNIVARLEALLAREHSPSEAFPLPAVD